MNKSIAVLKLLWDEKLLSEPFLKTMTSIAIHEAADVLGKELGYKVSAAALEKEVYKLVS